jgi:hypothetical protein
MVIKNENLPFQIFSYLNVPPYFRLNVDGTFSLRIEDFFTLNVSIDGKLYDRNTVVSGDFDMTLELVTFRVEKTGDFKEEKDLITGEVLDLATVKAINPFFIPKRVRIKPHFATVDVSVMIIQMTDRFCLYPLETFSLTDEVNSHTVRVDTSKLEDGEFKLNVSNSLACPNFKHFILTPTFKR